MGSAMLNRHVDLRVGRAVLTALLTAGSLVACLFPNDVTWERVRETGILRVGMDASLPPFEAIAADGSLVGFDVDLARELSQRLGAEPQFVANLPYDGLYDALRARRVDVVVSALVVNPARTADFAYSSPYFDAGPVLVLHQGERTIGSLAHLIGDREDERSLAVVLGTPADREARDWARRAEGLTVVQFPTAAQALGAVEVGQIDAALVDHVSALQAIGAGSSLTVVGEPIIQVPYAVGMRGDSQRLLREINRALADMESDGTLDTLVSRWLEGGG